MSRVSRLSVVVSRATRIAPSSTHPSSREWDQLGLVELQPTEKWSERYTGGANAANARIAYVKEVPWNMSE